MIHSCTQGGRNSDGSSGGVIISTLQVRESGRHSVDASPAPRRCCRCPYTTASVGSAAQGMCGAPSSRIFPDTEVSWALLTSHQQKLTSTMHHITQLTPTTVANSSSKLSTRKLQGAGQGSAAAAYGDRRQIIRRCLLPVHLPRQAGGRAGRQGR